MITVVVAFFIVIFDQLTKYLIQNFMQYGQTVPVIPDVFHLTYIINRGAAFGILPHKDWFFLSIVFILFYRNRITSWRSFWKCNRSCAYIRSCRFFRFKNLAYF